MMFKKIIKEICEEQNIKYTYLSKDWIIMLEKDNKVRYLTGNKFDLNGHAIGNIIDDKYALFCILNKLNIPICIHQIFYKEDNNNIFAKECHNRDDLIKCFNKFNKDVVIKPNKGSQGMGVYHITNEEELLEKTNLLFKNNYSISMCPFYHIKNEYRVIVLDNLVKLIYKKINPTVIGDGVHTLRELLINYNAHYFNTVLIPDYIPKKGEVYTYDFHFNLSKGSIASMDIEKDLKNKLISLAKDVTKRANIRFASVDIIETMDNKILVLEVNSGVTINKVLDFIPNGYNIAKDIYKEAILKMFD